MHLYLLTLTYNDSDMFIMSKFPTGIFVNNIVHLPFNRGQILHTVMPPSCMNCPSATSRKKSGIPAVTKDIRYGIRNAPEISHVVNTDGRFVRHYYQYQYLGRVSRQVLYLLRPAIWENDMNLTTEQAIIVCTRTAIQTRKQVRTIVTTE